MGINISAWAIKRPVPAFMLFVVLTLAGWYSFRHLSVQDFPDIDLPTITVSVSLPGGNPSQVETEVTRKVEDAVASLGKVEHIRSTVTDGSSSTSIEFSLDKNSQEALDEVRDAVSRIRSQLPNDVKEPQVSKVNIGGRAMVTFAVEAKNLSAEDLSWFVDNTVAKTLLAVKDVASVVRQGGVDREVQIRLDPVKLKSYGVTAAQVSQQLKATQQEASGGSTELGGLSQSVRTVGTVADVRALSRLDIALTDGKTVRLSELGQVLDTHAPVAQTALFDGREVVSFQVYRARGAGDVAVAAKVRQAVSKLATAHPQVSIREVSNNVDRIQKSYTGSMSSLYEGAALAIIVVWLFLRDWRATLVSAVALPLSIIPTFFAMDVLFGFSLNTVTLLAITLVVGILVDDAIVEVENIVRHLRMGKAPLEAATQAAAEIGLAVIATTLALVAVFLPTAFMAGVPGKFFKQFGWTAAIAVLASLLVARLLTPVMSAYFLKNHPAQEGPGRLMAPYLVLVRRVLEHPKKTLAAAALFFVASLVLVARIPTEFMPASDTGQVTLNIETPPGTLLEETARVSEQARRRIADIPAIAGIYTAIGSGTAARGMAAASPEARKATLTIALQPENARQLSQRQVESLVRERVADIPGARFSLGFGGSGEKYSMTLAGDDAAALMRAAEAVEADLRTVPGLGNVISSASLLRPELVVTPDAGLAAQAGVTTQSIGQALRVATSGDVDTALAKLNLSERQLAVRVRLDEAARTDLDTLAQLKVPARGGSLELKNVARLELSSGPAQIDRLDRQRNVTVSVELNGQRLGEVARQVAQLPSMKQLPASVKVLPSGDLERMGELFGSFGLAMAAGVLCVYLVLVLLFHNFSQPFTIMAALPLSAGGAFGMLALCGYSMSMPVLIGLLMLMGIVTKNSILLVEYAIVAQREHGLTRTQAILDACAKRAQPIVMTTVAMAAGMLPIALGYNGDAAFRSPMATAVIGGLITSTLLSLLVVPVVYEMVDDFTGWVRRRVFRRPV